MSASNLMETKILELIFKNLAFANVGDAGGLQPSAAAGSLYVSLHTANPDEDGNQSVNECAYAGPYARVAVARSAAGWTVAVANASNTAAVTFPACTGGSETATHFGVGVGASGGTALLFYAALDSNLAISNGITPEFAIGELDVDVE